jgi:hypothetical protein
MGRLWVMESREKIMSSMGIHLGVMAKVKPFSRRWRVGGSRVREERFNTVEGQGIEGGGEAEEQ